MDSLSNLNPGSAIRCAILWLIWHFSVAGAAAVLLPPETTPKFRSDRVLIKPKSSASEFALGTLHRSERASLRRKYPQMGNLQVIHLPPGESVTNALRRYRASGLVEYAEPDYILQAARVPNETSYPDGSQWALFNWGQLGGTIDCDIDAAEGWDFAYDASSVIVSVLDSGVRVTHEDLAANLWTNPGEIPGNGVDDDANGYIDDVHGINAVNGSGDLTDEFGHGTHVAGIYGAIGDNGIGMVGTAWRAKMINCKFLDLSLQGSVSDAVECINYSRLNGAKIVNASWGGKSPTTYSSIALYDAINSLRQAGIIFVAAAGNFAVDNDGPEAFYPASFDLDNIISVAATTRDDDLAHFSDYGLNSVDLGAPGYIVYSAWSGSDSDYRTDDGTSMSAPHVAAACALAWTLSPTSSYQQIIQIVLAGVDPIPALAGKCRTGGRLNLYKVLSAAAGNILRLQLTMRGLNTGQFEFRVSGPPNTSFQLQSSTNLIHWVPGATFQIPVAGYLDLTAAADASAKFFRTVAP
ncbi:MAG: S8 family serine peptidase [Akkermansiaceae bacterium]|nr:S8 family serine peptidase [Verrucomicrobiales bacterium]